MLVKWMILSDRLVSYIKKFQISQFIRAGFILTASNVVVGLLGFAYQILMGRMLKPEEFALFSTFMALIMFFGSPLNAMFMLISRRVAQMNLQNQWAALKKLYLNAHKLIIYISIGGALILVVFSNSIMMLLKTDSMVEIFIFLTSLSLSAFYNINNAFMQGLKRFQLLAGVAILTVILKVLLSIILIVVGYGVIGALSSLLLSYLIVWVYGGQKVGKFPVQFEKKPVVESREFCVKSATPVFIASIAFGAMTQLDMLLVNILFDPKDAAVYAAAAVLGKVILYLPAGLVLALFPIVVENHTIKKSSVNILKQSVFITVVLCGICSVLFWFFGDLIILFLFGSQYLPAGKLLSLYSFATLPMSLVIVAEHFLIAKGRTLFVWLFLCMCPLQVIGISFWHDELWNVIAVTGACGSILILAGYGMLWVEYQRLYKPS